MDSKLERGTAGRAELETYRYVSLGNFYVPADKAIGDLFARLWSQRTQFLGSEGKTRTRPSLAHRTMPTAALSFYQVSRLVARFLRLRSRPRDAGVLDLPVKGDFAIVRRSGAIKVLDLDGQRVFTLMMAPRDRGKLRERLRLAQQVERFDFAPAVEGVSLERGYFAEEFLAGAHPTDFRGCFGDFGSTYLPLIVDFICAEPLVERGLAEYASSLRRSILHPDSLLEQLPDADRKRVRDRVEASYRHLSQARKRLSLALSHGDFFSGNIVVAGDRVRAMDWAHVGRRSALHDLYYLVMNHCVRVMDPSALDQRFREMLDALRTCLAERDPARFAELESDLSADADLRHLFYLECIQVPLERCDRPDDRYIATMLQRVEWFDDFEIAVGTERRTPADAR